MEHSKEQMSELIMCLFTLNTSLKQNVIYIVAKRNRGTKFRIAVLGIYNSVKSVAG
jgi:hypothetical protein